MRRQFLLLLMAICLAACSPDPQPTTPAESPSGRTTAQPSPSGESASITVIVYQDLNQNAQLDPNEPGVADAIGLAPDTDCTIGDPTFILPAETDPATGEYTYPDLTPGLYCVLYRGAQPLTTEPAYTLTLASGERVEVVFGIKP